MTGTPSTWRSMLGHLVGLGIVAVTFLVLVLTGHAADSEPSALLALMAALVGGMIGVPLNSLSQAVSGLVNGPAAGPAAPAEPTAAPAAGAPNG